MKILIVYDGVIPSLLYGGVERIIWWLGKELTQRGHRVSYLVNAGSKCPFGKVHFLQPGVSLEKQIPDDTEFVHFFFSPEVEISKPHMVTIQTNVYEPKTFKLNTVFVSRRHARRHGCEAYVYNGLDPEDYGDPNLSDKRKHLHFLAKAAWKVKNVKGAIELAKRSGHRLKVVGGYRLNFKMGFRLTLDLHVKFHGMLGGEKKNNVLRKSKGLLFPVLWHEPFGISIIESLYFGCPVFGTPYGSLPELVPEEVGFLSNKKSELIAELKNIENYDRQKCHDYIMENFTVKQMTDNYLKYYEKIMDGASINLTKPVFRDTGEGKYLPWID